MRTGVCVCLSVMLLLTGCSGSDTDGDGGTSEQAALRASGAVSLEELSEWTFLGTGEVVVDAAEQAVRMSETEGSVGVTLVSPKRYGTDVVVRFDVRPSSYESVNVVILSSSDVATGGDYIVPDDYDGGFAFWTMENLQNYIVAFHNGAHDRKPFVIKSPGRELLAEADTHATAEKWHSVEVGRSGERVWLSVDGSLVVEGVDTSGSSLPGGRVALRLRGTPDALASAWFRNVAITAE